MQEVRAPVGALAPLFGTLPNHCRGGLRAVCLGPTLEDDRIGIELHDARAQDVVERVVVAPPSTGPIQGHGAARCWGLQAEADWGRSVLPVARPYEPSSKPLVATTR